MTINLSELAHIKVVVPNAERAYKIFRNIFDAEKLKEDFINSYIKVVYVGIGDFILQYIEPIAEEGPWHDHLQTKGPGVHSLAYCVENIKKAVEELEKEGGIVPLLSMDEEKGKFPIEFLNPKIKTQYIMNTMENIGFHLELGEKSSDIELTSPKTQYVTGRDNLIGDASTMLHIELVTHNGEKTYEFLNKIFGSNIVEKEFCSLITSEPMPIVHVNLSNVVLQYCQPLSRLVPTWYRVLRKNGSYVHNLNFLVDDIEKTVEKYKKENISYIFKLKLPGTEAHYYMMRTLRKLGFHMEHGQTPDIQLPPGFFFTDYKKETKK